MMSKLAGRLVKALRGHVPEIATAFGVPAAYAAYEAPEGRRSSSALEALGGTALGALPAMAIERNVPKALTTGFATGLATAMGRQQSREQKQQSRKTQRLIEAMGKKVAPREARQIEQEIAKEAYIPLGSHGGVGDVALGAVGAGLGARLAQKATGKTPVYVPTDQVERVRAGLHEQEIAKESAEIPHPPKPSAGRRVLDAAKPHAKDVAHHMGHHAKSMLAAALLHQAIEHAPKIPGALRKLKGMLRRRPKTAWGRFVDGFRRASGD